MNHAQQISTAMPWHQDIRYVLLLMIAITLPFWLTDLDTYVSSLFYHPELAYPWPVDRYAFWQFFYRGATAFTGVLLLGSLAILILLRRPDKRVRLLRLYAVYVLLVVVIGPGLIVNGVFKGYWGRPRPSTTIALGGDQQYLPPLAMGNDQSNKSFPAGHSSAGFAYIALWFIVRRRKRSYSRLALSFALLLGLLFGAGRIVGGAHFLSDVLWAGLSTYVAALTLYYYILKIPAREEEIENAKEHTISKLGYKEILGYGSLISVLVFASLLATPIKSNFNKHLDASAQARFSKIDYRIDTGSVEIRIIDKRQSSFDMLATVRDFGLPSSKVNVTYGSDSPDTLQGRIKHEGIFTEKNVRYVFSMDKRVLQKFSLSLGQGDITIMGDINKNDRDKLNIKVRDGQIHYRQQ